MVTVCPRCGNQLDGGDYVHPGDKVSCPACNFKFKFTEFVPCPLCGEVIAPGLRICPKCGGRIAARASLKAKTIAPEERYIEKPLIARKATEEWTSRFKGEASVNLIFSCQRSGLHRGIIGLLTIMAGVILFDCINRSMSYFRQAETLFQYLQAAMTFMPPAMIAYFICRAGAIMLPSTSAERKWNDFDLLVCLMIPTFGFFSGMPLWQVFFMLVFDGSVCTLLSYPISYRLNILEYRISNDLNHCPDCKTMLDNFHYGIASCPGCGLKVIREEEEKTVSRAIRFAGEIFILITIALYFFFAIMGSEERNKFLSVASFLLVASGVGIIAVLGFLIYSIYQKKQTQETCRCCFYRLPESWHEEIISYVKTVKFEWLIVILIAITAFGLLLLIRILPEFLQKL